MGKIFSTVTDAIGLTDTKAERNAAQSAARAADNANALAADNIEFQKEQYNDWKAIYGDIQTNLGEYYKTLGPEKVAALGLTAQQQEYQVAIAEIKRTNAQRGLSDSVYEKSALDTMTMQNATARATIRASAENTANQEKTKFLGLGLGQGESMLGNIGNATNTGVNAFSNQSNTLMGRSNQLNATNSKTLNNVFDQATSAAGYFVK